MFSFRLTEEFIHTYVDRKVDWGYKDAGGNSLGEITFLRTYSRIKEDGTKEKWYEVCERVINGTFSIQKDHAKANRLPWNDNKAQKTAQDAFERMFTFKWTPPGRGLWVMGTPLVNVHRNSAALQNCAFISTADMTKTDPAGPFAFLMEASMLGIGVGFDNKGAEKGFTLHEPLVEKAWVYTIPDTREGWVQAMVHVVESYLMPSKGVVHLDTSLVRPAGAPIATFGGTAAGPAPLIRLTDSIRDILGDRGGQELTKRDILDIGNLIGVCVVSGNVRRSAELAIGSIDDKDFLNAKDFGQMVKKTITRSAYLDAEGYELDPKDVSEDRIPELIDEEIEEWVPGSAAARSEWGWMSNNSVDVTVGTDLTPVVEGIARNGEPGVIWMDVSRKYGRLIDPPTNADSRVAGYNPCAEQSLESGECCTLVETYLNRHDSLEDFKRTLKVAFMYAKTVTLLPTHWAKTNAIMQRNRRIGTSISGIANFADRRSMTELRQWMDEGYKTVRYYDRVYSEWLCVRESVKVTTVKPSGTVSILAGESPGVHWAPGGEYFMRGIVFQEDDPIVAVLRTGGYEIVPSAYTPNTVFVQFPVHSNARRNDKKVPLFEKAALAVEAQRWWSDNSVSVTLSFNAETEGDQVGTILHMYEGQMKTVSFLPQGNKTYLQMPYQEIGLEEYEDAEMRLMRLDLDPIYAGMAFDAIGEAYCTTDACEVKTITNSQEVAA